MKHTLSRISLILGASGLLAVGLATTASAATPTWQQVLSVANSSVSGTDGGAVTFDTVIATGATTGWAFPTGGTTAYERTGATTWTPVALPGHAGRVTAAGASSPSDVWAVDDNSGTEEFLHWNGSAWSTARTQETGAQVTALSVLSATDVWAFGGWDGSGGIWHWDGLTWAYVSSTLQGGSALADNDVWAFSGSAVDHYDGTTWTSTSVADLLPNTGTAVVTGILALSADNVYAIGNGGEVAHGNGVTLLHYDGTSWTKVATTTGVGGQQLTSDGAGGVWLIAVNGNQEVLHYTGGNLTVVNLPSATSQPVEASSLALIPGTNGLLVGGYQYVTTSPSYTSNSVVLQYS